MTDDAFQSRIHAAAIAAWWTLLLAGVFFLLQWLLYLGITSSQPAWVVSFWGPGATWESIRTLWFDALIVLKLSLWPLVLIAMWLTLWARRLRGVARTG